MGALAGLLATLVILATSRVLGWVIQGIDGWLRPSEQAERRFTARAEGVFTRGRDHFVRGAVLGAAGLLLSAVCTALFAPGQTSAADGQPPDGLVTFLRAAGLPVAGWIIGTGVVWLLWERGFRSGRGGAGLHFGITQPRAPRPPSAGPARHPRGGAGALFDGHWYGGGERDHQRHDR